MPELPGFSAVRSPDRGGGDAGVMLDPLPAGVSWLPSGQQIPGGPRPSADTTWFQANGFWPAPRQPRIRQSRPSNSQNGQSHDDAVAHRPPGSGKGTQAAPAQRTAGHPGDHTYSKASGIPWTPFWKSPLTRTRSSAGYCSAPGSRGGATTPKLSSVTACSFTVKKQGLSSRSTPNAVLSSPWTAPPKSIRSPPGR